MRKFDQEKALIQSAEEYLRELKNNYEQSLVSKQIDLSLQVQIKNILENLRSALDYVAVKIYDKCSSSKAASKIYFPIARKGAKGSDFVSIVEKNIPDCLKTRPDLVKLLESFQEFTNPNNDWLPDLATLCNENKHVQLTPQTKTEKVKRITVKTKNSEMGWDPASVHFGSGVSIGGVPVNPSTQLPVPSPTHTVEKEIWVDFQFDNNKSVLPFLQECVKGVKDIVEILEKKIINR